MEKFIIVSANFCQSVFEKGFLQDVRHNRGVSDYNTIILNANKKNEHSTAFEICSQGAESAGRSRIYRFIWFELLAAVEAWCSAKEKM